PLRGECRAISGVTVVTNACAFYTTHAAAGRTGRPAFPAPSVVRKAGRSWQTSREMRGEIAKLCLRLFESLNPLASSLRTQGPIRRGLSIRTRRCNAAFEAANAWGYGARRSQGRHLEDHATLRVSRPPVGGMMIIYPSPRFHQRIARRGQFEKFPRAAAGVRVGAFGDTLVGPVDFEAGQATAERQSQHLPVTFLRAR
ncbi:MAG: hypothetical protein QOI87_3009, partial [Bradyrhizobium sp.]|nr:hypothetical protein [Bradyrhizobium sp.]